MSLSSSKASICDILSFIMSVFSISMKIAILRLDTIYSIGINTYCPYINLKVVYPVNLLHVVLYAKNTARILMSQSYLFMFHILVNAFSRILFPLSHFLEDDRECSSDGKPEIP